MRLALGDKGRRGRGGDRRGHANLMHELTVFSHTPLLTRIESSSLETFIGSILIIVFNP
jgi:hypothetical protein